MEITEYGQVQYALRVWMQEISLTHLLLGLTA